MMNDGKGGKIDMYKNVLIISSKDRKIQELLVVPCSICSYY